MMNFNSNNISVVMATFNGARYLDEQLQSIVEQTILPEELIICDDGSTDNTIQIIQNYKKILPIKLIINELRLGVAANFKKAAALAKQGNYIAFADQDDIWLQHKLEKNLNLIKASEKDNIPALVYSDVIFIDQTKQIINISFYNEVGLDKFNHCFNTSLYGSLLLGCTLMINDSMKQYLLQMPVSKAYHHDAWMALIGFGLGEVAYCKEPLIQYRMHEDNESLSNFTKSPRWLKALVHLAKMPFLSSYLNNEIELASAFKTLYEKQIPASKLEAINNLISLKGKIYFQKKWGFEKAFKNQWIKRF